MEQETLEDHLRRATRNFTARLPEEQVFVLGRDLAQELARAHAETPPRHPEMEPASIVMVDGKPQLTASSAAGDSGEDLFRLGALLSSLASGTKADVSWRLDGPPPVKLSDLRRRAILATLSAPRRTDRYATATDAAAALESALQPEAQGPSPWSLFRGEAGRQAARPGPAGSLLALWEARVGGVVASPVVMPALVLAPSADGRLLFLDRRSGRKVHELRLGSAVESSPALSASFAYVGTDDGELVAVNPLQGEERYRVRVGQLVRSSPLPVSQRVFVGVVESKAAGALLALDAEKGKMLWARKMGAVFSSPTLAGSSILVGSDDGSLHAVDVEKGTLIWSHAIGGKVRATAAVGGELAVVGSFDGRLVAVRLADGSRVWTTEIGHSLYSSPCIAGGLCVVGCHDGHVHGVDLAAGTPRFEVQTRGPVVSSPVAVGDAFLVGSTDGGLYLIDSGGRIRSRVTLSPHGIQSSAALDGDELVVGSADGVHALRLQP